MNHFSGEDLVFYQEDDKIMSGGYLIDSILLKQGVSPMTTLNYSGGSDSSSNKVSNIFENLAVPAGLLYTYKKGGSINQYVNTSPFKKPNHKEDIVLSDDIHDELYKQIEMNLNKNNSDKNAKSKAKTKRNIKIKKINKHSKKIIR